MSADGLLFFRVVAAGDPYTGEVGTLQRVTSDDDGLIYVLRFCIEHTGSLCHSAFYRRDELSVA